MKTRALLTRRHASRLVTRHLYLYYLSFALLLHSTMVMSTSRYLDGELIYRIKAEHLVLKHSVASGTIPDEPMCVRSCVLFVRAFRSFVRSFVRSFARFIWSRVLFACAFCLFARFVRSPVVRLRVLVVRVVGSLAPRRGRTD